jgi:ornithine lipid ester-linked acyl 2-hydroxylase
MQANVSAVEHVEKPEFFLSEDAVYHGTAPFFFSNEQYPWVQLLENNWTIIRDEMTGIIGGKDAITLSSPNPPYLSKDGAWSNIYFFNFMWKYKKNCKKYPKTYALLTSIPNLTFAEFTVLEAGCSILPHIGETNTTIRGHLGISIPASLPIAGIRVGSEERGWENGKAVLFSDAHRHTVWNNSDKRRFVLVFDVMKDEYAPRKYWYCAQALSTLVIKGVGAKVNIFSKLPDMMLYPLHYLISFLWYLYLPIQSRG